MKTLRYAMFAGATLFATAAAAQAQARTGGGLPGRMGGTMGPTSAASSRSVPPGLCQVWIDGVSPDRQPAPTDCDTARRQARSNSRVIYGPRSSTGGVYYPNGQYDPRYDPRSPQYDPRTGQYGGQSYPGERGRGNRDWKAEKEREKAERKQQKEREKQWKKANEGRDHDDEDDDGDHRGNGERRRGHDDEDRGMGRTGSSVNAPVYGRLPRTTTTTTTTTRGCVDANRDGVCDIMQTARGRRP